MMRAYSRRLSASEGPSSGSPRISEKPENRIERRAQFVTDVGQHTILHRNRDGGLGPSDFQPLLDILGFGDVPEDRNHRGFFGRVDSLRRPATGAAGFPSTRIRVRRIRSRISRQRPSAASPRPKWSPRHGGRN